MISESAVNDKQVERDATETFLHLLSSYPWLYNRQCDEFHITVWRDNALGEIARNMHEPGIFIIYLLNINFFTVA